MALVTVRPTESDVAIANAIAKNTNVPTEKFAGALTWGADEHILRAMAATWWLFTRARGQARRRAADHVLLRFRIC